jgi:hypothetical protein
MELLGILSAFGRSASAGLNAYIPLLIVALLAKFTNLIQLSSPWDALTSWWIIALLVVLTLVEFFADKVPAVNHVNDAMPPVPMLSPIFIPCCRWPLDCSSPAGYTQ